MEHLKVSKVSEIIVTCMVHCSCVVSTFIWEILYILRQVIYLIMRKAKGCITLLLPVSGRNPIKRLYHTAEILIQVFW